MVFAYLESDVVKEILERTKCSKSVTIFAICGGSCTGKTTLANYISSLGLGNILPMDAFYKPIQQIPQYLSGIPAFDSPSAFDLDLLKVSIKRLKMRERTKIPVYRYSNIESGRDLTKEQFINPHNLIILDGILSLCEKVRSLVDISLYLERNQLDCFNDRINRDTNERGVDEQSAIEMYNRMTIPLFEKYIVPQKLIADFVLENK